MDYGKRSLIFLILCALVGAATDQQIKTDLQVLVSVPSTHLRETEIETNDSASMDGHAPMYTIVAKKNETQCTNSTDFQCIFSIKEPKVDVLVSANASNGKTFTYSQTFNGSHRLMIHVDPDVSVTTEMMNSQKDKISVILDLIYDRTKTSMGLPSYSRQPTTFSLNVEFLTTYSKGNGTGNGTDNVTGNGTDNGTDNGPGNGTNNGQSSLCSAPFISLLVLALFPVFLLK